MNKSRFTNRLFTVLGRTGVASLALSAPVFSGEAIARPRLTLDGSVLAGASSNPYLGGGGNKGSATVTASLSPRLTLQGPKSIVSIGGTVRHTEYTSAYPSSDGASIGVSGQWQPDAKIRINGTVDYDNSIAGEGGNFIDDLNRVPLFDDLALGGLRVRREFIRAEVTTSYQPSARDSFSVGVNANLADVGQSQNFQTNDYASYGGSIGYSRGIDQRTSIGVTFGANRYECRSGFACRTTTLQPQITFTRVLNSRWTLQGAGGVALNNSRFPNFSGKRTTIAANLGVCRKSTRSTLCFDASRTTQSTSTFGARPSTTISAQLNTKVNSRTSVTGQIAYGNSSEGFAAGVPGAFNTATFTYWSARLSGNRQIAENVSLTLSGGYDRSSDLFASGRSNVEVLMGVSFWLGRR